MNSAVRYYSQTGNTRKLADAIAEVAGVTAATTSSPVTDDTDVLFLGASVYWAGIDSEVKKFIASLDPKRVQKVVVFSTSALAERAFPSIEKLLKARGIAVSQDNFYCRGEFKFMHKGKPDAADIAEVKAFAKKVLGI
ncbi:MAG: flavodoxin [Pseudobutyrivibrio sp.]|nr:flavodoxin [Pseudobutyrivibrio sp.]